MVRLWALLVVGLAVALGARGVGPGAEQAAGMQQAAEDPHPSPLPKGEGARAAQAEARFEAIDIFVDSGAVPLAAYQVEVRAVGGDVRLVGVEGGEHAAFAGPPHYDPKALHEGQMNERIVVAAFSTAGELPVGRTRVARLHVRVGVGTRAGYEVRVMAAGGRDGKKIGAAASLASAATGDRK